MKKTHKIIIGVLVFIFLISVVKDWKNFKAGLFGNPPIVETIK